MTHIIEVDSVTKSFGGVVANHDVSMSVEQGRITGLIGRMAPAKQLCSIP